MSSIYVPPSSKYITTDDLLGYHYINRYYVTNTIASSGSILAIDYGVKADGTIDDTVALRNAITAAYGKTLILPSGTMLISGTLTISSSLIIEGQGSSSIIKYNGASGSAIIPIIDVTSTATGTVLQSFSLNHNANRTIGAHTGDWFVCPTVYNGNLIAGSCVLIQADNCRLLNLNVSNAWDNAIAVCSLNSNGTGNSGSPKYCSISKIKTSNAGCGYHNPPNGAGDRNGDGVDLGTASCCSVSDCEDDGSACSFAQDIGGGAGSNTYVNCISNNARNASDSPGLGFYVASGDSTFTNCIAVNSGKLGWWVDDVNNCDFVNCQSNGAQQHGWQIKNGPCSFTNCRSKNSSQAGSNLYDGFFIDASGGVAIPSLTFDNCQTSGSSHRYGLNVSSGFNVSGSVIGGSFNGVTSSYNMTGSNCLMGLIYNNNSATQIGGSLRIIPNSENVSYTQQAFGDWQGNGSFFIQDHNNTDKRIGMGIDPTFTQTNSGVTGCGIFQCIDAAVLTLPILIQPSGGDVLLSKQGNQGYYPYIPSNNQLISGTPNNYTGWNPVCFDSKNDKLNVYNSTWKYAPIVVGNYSSGYGSSLVRNTYTTPGSLDSTTYKISGTIEVNSYTSGSLQTFLSYTSPTGSSVNTQLPGYNNILGIVSGLDRVGSLGSFDQTISCNTGTNITVGTTGSFSGSYSSSFKIIKI